VAAETIRRLRRDQAPAGGFDDGVRRGAGVSDRQAEPACFVVKAGPAFIERPVC